MKRRTAGILASFGLLLIFLGVYFFPFGYDVVFYIVMTTIGHNDYWYTTLLFYIGCISLILIGYILIRRWKH